MFVNHRSSSVHRVPQVRSWNDRKKTQVFTCVRVYMRRCALNQCCGARAEVDRTRATPARHHGHICGRIWAEVVPNGGETGRTRPSWGGHTHTRARVARNRPKSVRNRSVSGRIRPKSARERPNLALSRHVPCVHRTWPESTEVGPTLKRLGPTKTSS